MDDPFRKADEILEEVKDKEITYSIVDFRAECSSEKYALGFYLDGRVDAIVGTHTHVPTCDQMVLPRKTLYISDIGMSGIVESVLGVEKEIIIEINRLEAFSKEMVEDEYILQKYNIDEY